MNVLLIFDRHGLFLKHKALFLKISFLFILLKLSVPLTLFKMGKAKMSPTSFLPVSSTNVEISL